MSGVKVRKGQVTIPTLVRSRLGILDGDVLDVKVSSNCVVLTPKRVYDLNGHTPEQRKIIDAHLAQGLDDVKKGRIYGPFPTVAELERSMREVAKKPVSKRKH